MLRQESIPRIEPELNGRIPDPDTTPVSGAPGVDIQRELNRLEEMVLYSPRIPLTRRTLVDEQQLLDQLDLIRLNLPSAFQEADIIARHKDEILQEAEEYAQEILEAAEHRAIQILNELGIIQQAQAEADRIRQQVQAECEAIQQQAFTEIDQARYQTQQEIDEIRSRTVAECQEIQDGADDYADHVLDSIEQQLSDMLRVIRNGRQHLQSNVSYGQM
ncbi:MAG: DivIVA domain-containing protein [Oscillatoriales cyanobacterium RM1_1_9]|nr:DivIVA domain-containing protein [Oscillatoriales cyanobacterium SM2_3_0]NJO45133.1 DivIVA domain-containing protein [Oscillatoriales cyanobacterium RM2_1_1]NJO71262.1 DivIVA domain-containing protein [Oscillatoriales cyanobacterium RM1_1_9]